MWDDLSSGHKLRSKSRKGEHRAQLVCVGYRHQSKGLWGSGGIGCQALGLVVEEDLGWGESGL